MCTRLDYVRVCVLYVCSCVHVNELPMIAKRKGAQEHTAQEKDTRRLVKPGEPKGRGDGEREKNRIRQRQQNETTKGEEVKYEYRET